ncbi:FxsA family protein [Nocardioides sp. CFH 31398]|uniref:FxsA family protein n=1 Tax=Nocardioides sp. CFH 31398 TaxID=2919579 RepID=UPI001F0588D7|nr:FxsA family protein [Nocardioides sp. CFH 31398]MCH1866878.1 FxsA family protein [Nocardioides sp. CFH 31398]
MSSPGAARGGPGAPPPRRRRSPVLTVLALTFLVVPLVELFVLIQVGEVIGAWPTVGLLLLSAVVGGWLVRREGRRAWRALTTALQSGRMPARELADAGLVLVGGVLMVAPGFVTDLVGILLILPLTRPLARAALTGMVARRLLAGGAAYGGPTGGGTTNGPRPPRGTRPDGHDVVRGEVVDPPDDGR